MICPACRQEMIIVEYKQIELDVCPECKGVWFDADELELLLDSLGLAPGQLVRPLPEKPAEKPRRCLYCRRKMAKVLMGPGDGVMIDRCKHGHGLWFDGGELDTIIQGLRRPEVADQPDAEAGEGVGSFLADVLLAGGDEDEGQTGGEQ